ncbi:MAG: hypothetical protein ABIN96_10045 [Rubrivivax sp.]
MRLSALPVAIRVLLTTLALALAFVALGRLQMAVFAMPATERLLQRWGWISGNDEARWQQQTAEVAEASQPLLGTLPAGHRAGILELGFQIGYVSQWLGGYALAPAEVRDRMRSQQAPRLARARELAQRFGVGDVDALPVTSLREYAELKTRHEDDASGIAARIEIRLSPLHRHLYLLGVHLGGEWSRVDSSHGELSLPPASAIRRHAVLAGIGAAVWQPLVQAPEPSEAPAAVLRRYGEALAALGTEMARQDAANDPERAPTTAPPR